MAVEETRLDVRASLSQVALRQEINRALGTHIKSLKKDPALRRRIATEWAQAVTPFVPRSNQNVQHHLQDYRVESDGRVVWTRRADRDDVAKGIAKGDQIAGKLYEGPIRGKKFKVRVKGGAPGYGRHRPVPHWVEQVQPGTSQWTKFVAKITPVVKRWIKNG